MCGIVTWTPSLPKYEFNCFANPTSFQRPLMLLPSVKSIWFELVPSTNNEMMDFKSISHTWQIVVGRFPAHQRLERIVARPVAVGSAP